MEEMLPEIRVKKSARATMTGALHTLKALFESLPSKAMREVPFAPPCLGRLALSVAQAPCSLNGRAVLSRSRPASRRAKAARPLRSPPTRRPSSFSLTSPHLVRLLSWARPRAMVPLTSYCPSFLLFHIFLRPPLPPPPLHTSVAVIGSFLVQLQARPVTHVDVAVEMPSSVVEAKDHLNHRYLHKRAYYLAVLADALIASKDFKDVQFESFEGNPMKPILVCRPTEGKMQIRIFPSITPDTFKVRGARGGPEKRGGDAAPVSIAGPAHMPLLRRMLHPQLSKLSPSRNNVRRAKNAELLPGAKKEALEGRWHPRKTERRR